MTSDTRWAMTGLTAVLLVAGTLAAHDQSPPAASPSPESLLRQMSEELKGAGTYRFHAEIEFDDVLVSGQKLQYAGAADVTVRCPDGVYIDYRDDISEKRFWYDGKIGTLLDVVTGKYSQVDLPDQLDAAVDRLQERHDLSLPLVDLISSDVFAKIDARAVAWGYVGVHDAGGAPAHHLAIRGEAVDLQLWIKKVGRPLPLKLVITYKNVPMAPQYEALLMDWEVGAEVAAGTFAPDLPEGAQEIELLVVEGRK